MGDNPVAIRPRTRGAARAGIAVLALAIVGGGIAIGLSTGGSPSPAHPRAASADTHKGATATTTLPSTTTTVGPNTSTTTAPVKVGAPGATTEPTAPTKSTTTTTKQTPPVTPSPAVKPTTTTTPTTTATAAPAGGNCTNPIFSTSDAQGTDNTDPSDGHQYWWIDNDAWSGSAGPQSLSACNQSSWYAVSNQPNVGGQVETYPDTEYDVGGRDTPSTTPISGWNSITSSFSEAYPPAGGWDAAYDLWLNNWTTEIMIWNQWAGGQSYWPDQATTAVTLDGVGYKFYNNGGELMFFRDTQVTSGSVDILAALQWLASQGIVKSTDVPTQLEYGVEVCYTNGPETFPMTGLTFNLS